jgi:hypothetical protein
VACGAHLEAVEEGGPIGKVSGDGLRGFFENECRFFFWDVFGGESEVREIDQVGVNPSGLVAGLEVALLEFFFGGVVRHGHEAIECHSLGQERRGVGMALVFVGLVFASFFSKGICMFARVAAS